MMYNTVDKKQCKKSNYKLLKQCKNSIIMSTSLETSNNAGSVKLIYSLFL